MATWTAAKRFSIISSCGIVCGLFNYHNPKLKCETEKKYHAWNETWKRLRKNKTIPPWDPGVPTTATKFLSNVDIIPKNTNTNTKDIKILVPLCGSSHDMDYIEKYYNDEYKDGNINIKIIGIEMSEEGIKSFLERVIQNNNDEWNESEESQCSFWIEYDEKIPIYRYKNYHLVIINNHNNPITIKVEYDRKFPICVHV